MESDTTRVGRVYKICFFYCARDRQLMKRRMNPNNEPSVANDKYTEFTITVYESVATNFGTVVNVNLKGE